MTLFSTLRRAVAQAISKKLSLRAEREANPDRRRWLELQAQILRDKNDITKLSRDGDEMRLTFIGGLVLMSLYQDGHVVESYRSVSVRQIADLLPFFFESNNREPDDETDGDCPEQPPGSDLCLDKRSATLDSAMALVSAWRQEKLSDGEFLGALRGLEITPSPVTKDTLFYAHKDYCKLEDGDEIHLQREGDSIMLSVLQKGSVMEVYRPASLPAILEILPVFFEFSPSVDRPRSVPQNSAAAGH